MKRSRRRQGVSRRLRTHRGKNAMRIASHNNKSLLVEDITGAGGGHKNYGPLNYESAPGWDRDSIDALMSDNVPSQELAQSNVAAPDMTKDYIDRYLGFLPPNLLKNIISHEKSRRRHRIDSYFRTEHGRLPPRISRLLYGSYTPPEYGRKPSSRAATRAAPPPPRPPSPISPPYPPSSNVKLSPAPSSVGSSLNELVEELIGNEQVQQHEIKSAQNAVEDLDTILEVLNSGIANVKEHLSTASSPQEEKPSLPPPLPSESDDDYLMSLTNDLPSFDFGEQPTPTPPTAENRYIAMKRLGSPPSSPPSFDDDSDEESSSSSTHQPHPLSQRIARKSMSNILRQSVPPTPSPPNQQQPVSNVRKLLRTVFRDHATGKRNTKDATHKILDIAHNITKEHIQ